MKSAPAAPSIVTDTLRTGARRRGGWTPIYILAALGFAFAIGFGERSDPSAARVVLALASASVALAVVLIGQVVLTLRGRFRFRFLEELPTHAALEEEKRQVLTAIKEIEFDRSMNKVNDRDYTELRKRYEAEALRVLKAIDEERALWREKAEKVAAEHLASAGLGGARKAPASTGEPAAADKTTSPPSGEFRVCPSCRLENDRDARFCKKCGNNLGEVPGS